MQECIDVKRVRVRAHDRRRLERRLELLVRGEALQYQQRADLNPRLEWLRRRFLAGETVTLADVFDAAGLSPREQHVILERLPRPDGVVRSHEQIATDGVMRKPDGSLCSRQRVEQVEAEALRKLGLTRSIAAAVHGAERAGRALALMASGQAVPPDELHGPAPVRVRLRWRKARWEVEHEAAVRAFLKSRACPGA
jgi:hypothetical protein